MLKHYKKYCAAWVVPERCPEKAQRCWYQIVVVPPFIFLILGGQLLWQSVQDLKHSAVTRVTGCNPFVRSKFDLSPQMHPDQKLNGFEELSPRQNFWEFFHNFLLFVLQWPASTLDPGGRKNPGILGQPMKDFFDPPPSYLSQTGGNMQEVS